MTTKEGLVTEIGGDQVVRPEQPIDWMDLACAVFVGVVFALLKLAKFKMPAWQIGMSDCVVPLVLTFLYIVLRARRQPEKLDEWGITAPIPLSAIAMGLLLLGVTAGVLATAGLKLAGRLSFHASYVPQMVNYLLAAFPQQFFMCSVGLATLAKFRLFRGSWRLPLIAASLFGLAHFWVPFHFPGTGLPIQIIGTFPLGFAAAFYFLRFRTILPLTVIHAIAYVLFHNWLELPIRSARSLI